MRYGSFTGAIRTAGSDSSMFRFSSTLPEIFPQQTQVCGRLTINSMRRGNTDITTAQYSLWFIFGYIFNHYIKKHAVHWWKRYNCQFKDWNFLSICRGSTDFSFLLPDLLQAAMDTGTALATIIIFFALSYNNITLSWWGNNVGSNTDDSNSVPWSKVATGGHFGRGPGEF